MASSLPPLPGYKPKGKPRTIRYRRVPEEQTSDIIGSPLKPKRNQEVTNEAIILSFQGYFLENQNGEDKPRMCQIDYYVQGGEIGVTLKPQANSTLHAGTLFHRAVFLSPEGYPYEPKDLDLDKPIILNSITFFLVDCDHSTREYIRRTIHGFELSTTSTMFESKLSITDDWNKFHSKKNENKTFLEAQLGNSVDNGGREGFLRFGTNVLKFRLHKHDPSVDDIVLEFSLVYHLADDTIEVFSLGDYNGNRNGFSKLLKRCKLPKSMETMSIIRPGDSETIHYHWTDFSIGTIVNVYNRQLRIIDADEYSRSVYEEIDCPLGPAEVIEEALVQQVVRQIPAPTGFGSDEDSLRSCIGSLRLGAPAIKVFGENKSFCFKAKLLNGTLDDVDRDFVVTYYFLDGTVSVIEPPKRNSGFLGGTFLSRRKMKTPDGVEVNDSHMYVGARVPLAHTMFELIESDSHTYQMMEDMGYSKASINEVLKKIKGRLYESAVNGSLLEMFCRIEGLTVGRGSSSSVKSSSLSGQASQDTLCSVLSSFGLLGDDEQRLCTHEVITIVRAYAVEKGVGDHFLYTPFIKALLV